MREYVRQALDKNQLDPRDAVMKIANTSLGQQFPDTMDEWDAHAFYYQQQLGMI